MRTLAILLLTAFFQVGGPTQVEDPAYPLRVRILGRNIGGSGTFWGRGDVFSPAEQGFDYQTDCSTPFMRSEGDERYSARWKKQDKELEILISRIGTNRSEKCALKVDLKPFIYDIDYDRHRVVTRPLEK